MTFILWLILAVLSWPLALLALADFVASQTPSPSEQGVPARLDIVSVAVSGETAIARVRDDYLGMTFLDSLSLLFADGRWQIYTKLFNVEGPVAASTSRASA